MTLSSREFINRAILDAIHEAGAVGVHVPDSTTHPRKYMIVRDGEQSTLWVYCWRLTPGGRPYLPNEYRIQMTSVSSPLDNNQSGYTVILGYEPTRGVFAGYDVSRHQTFTTGSSSVQINTATLNKSLQTGIAFQTKSNQEVVIGIRNDLLLFYCEHATELHELGEDSGYLDEVVTHSAELEEGPTSEANILSQKRQIVIQETSHLSRSASFRRQVLSAYENRCAVTRRQLKLVDAAHILPVAAGDRSIDDVRNGIALSPTYHRAFDNGLIFLDDHMVMRLNEDAVGQLRSLDLDGGIDGFAVHLGLIHLPMTTALRPDPYFIRLANQYRGLG